MRKISVGELVFDFSVYPRINVDSGHLTYIREAIATGNVMPPLVVETKSMRLVDGFHRGKAYLSLYGPDHKIDVVEKKYENEAALFSDAIRYNAHHGRSLSRYDRVHCLLIAERLDLTLDVAASALGMSVQKCGELRINRTAETSSGNEAPNGTVALKQTIRHMAGHVLTPGQVTANGKLSGMNQVFYVNQLITLIESDLIDTDNEEVLSRLRHLAGLIRGMKIAKAA